MKRVKQIISVILSIAMIISMCTYYSEKTTVKADATSITLGNGSIANTVPDSNGDLIAKLPTVSNQGTYRFTTDNYNSNYGAFDTNNWATSAMWSLDGKNKLSGSIYAFPLSYRANSTGMWITKPSTIVADKYIQAVQPSDGTLTDFSVGPDWTCGEANVDSMTDWTYDVVETNPDNSSQSMKTTMTQGSPFGFFQMTNSTSINITRKRSSLPSEVVSYNGNTIADSTMLVLRVYDNTDGIKGYSNYDYYAVYVPTGTTWTQTDNSYPNNIGVLKANFPSTSKAYMTFAWLCETSAVDDDTAIGIANNYKKYAYNFITDTKADYSYDSNTQTVSTTYKYTIDKKSESTANGTVMGVLPHQYKNMSGYTYLSNIARTLRGNIKYITGDNYTTEMKYTGILPFMPNVADDDSSVLADYVTEFMNNYMPSNRSDYTLTTDEGGGDTYWTGKLYNRSSNVMAAAESVGDTTSADKILTAMEKGLSDWFTYSGSTDKKYFAYYDQMGALYGFPTSYNAVDQMNDHHFHYGYFIEAAAQVGLRDSSFLIKYGAVVEELINDIACSTRNSSSSKYPYLRNFSPYEGHSWASGFEDTEAGNNQESTSEAINAWAAIITYGEVTGNTKLRDLGIYLYTTEVTATEDYWFDYDGDVIDSNYTANNNMVSLLWGGKICYETWFSGNPYQVQGIQLLPTNAWSMYLGKNKDFVNKSIEKVESSGQDSAWNDVWAEYYALSDPVKAYDYWKKGSSEEGESKAHTYQYIKSLANYGTPDLSITSNTTFSTVFKDDSGVKTYAVYNPTSTVKTVTFSDGTSINASANKLSMVNEGQLTGEAYNVEYYLKDLNGSGYSLYNTEVKYAENNTNVTASEKNISGCTFDNSNVNNIKSGTVTQSGLTLKLYYNRNTYSVNYNLNGGTMSEDTSINYTFGQSITLPTPTNEGYTFSGWYSDSTYTTKITEISEKTTGDFNLYAKWTKSGTIVISDSKYISFDGSNATFTVNGYTDYSAIMTLYKVYDTEDEAKDAVAKKSTEGFVAHDLTLNNGTWTWTKDFSSQKGKYLVAIYNSFKSGGGTLSDMAYGQIPTDESVVTTTSSENITTEKVTSTEIVTSTSSAQIGTTTKVSSLKAPDGLVVHNYTSTIGYYVIAFAGISDALSYNLYVDGVFVKAIANGGYYSGSGLVVGNHYAQVSAVYEEGESGLSSKIVFKVADKETTEAQTTIMQTTEAETTVAPITQPETTVPATEPETTTKYNIVTNDNVKVEGYQISTTLGGSRTVASVEPTINEKKVTGWGLVYGIAEIDGNTYSVNDDEMYVGSSNENVMGFASTSDGTIDAKMGDSTTATYYVRTMLFSAFTSSEFTAKYKVRAYAVLEDGSYVYSKVYSYSINMVADALYQGNKMGTLNAHNYLYTKILQVVDPTYKEVDFNWSNTIVK